MSFWGKWASIPTKKSENKTVCVFFQGASDGNAKIGRNISQKSKNNETLDLKQNGFGNFFPSGQPQIAKSRAFGWSESKKCNSKKRFQKIQNSMPCQHRFLKIRLFKNPVFRYFLILGLYFDVFWHYHQTRLEKTHILSYFHNFSLELRPVYAKTVS